MKRKILWTLFLGALFLILGLKAAQFGWFTPRSPIILDGEPVLLFFNKARGCECEMLVYNNTNAQIDHWNAPLRIIRIDLELRPDLAKQYDVIRAPTLILLNSVGQVVWKQNRILSDEAPLDLKEVEVQVSTVIEGSIPYQIVLVVRHIERWESKIC